MCSHFVFFFIATVRFLCFATYESTFLLFSSRLFCPSLSAPGRLELQIDLGANKTVQGKQKKNEKELAERRR